MKAKVLGKLLIATVMCACLGTSVASATGVDLDTIKIEIRGTPDALNQAAYRRSQPLEVALTYQNVEGMQQLPDTAAQLQIYRQIGNTLSLVSATNMTLYSLGGTIGNRITIDISEHAVVTIARGSVPAYTLTAGTYVIMVHVKSPTVVFPPQIGYGGNFLTATAQAVITVI